MRERVAGIKPARKEIPRNLRVGAGDLTDNDKDVLNAARKEFSNNDWKEKNWRQDLLDTDKKSADDIWKENEALYKEYGGFADTGDPVRNKEVEKAHAKWLRNRELARAKEKDDYSRFAGWELYSDDPNRFGDTMKRYNEKQSLRQKYSGTIDYLQRTTDMSLDEILDLLRKRGK